MPYSLDSDDSSSVKKEQSPKFQDGEMVMRRYIFTELVTSDRKLEASREGSW